MTVVWQQKSRYALVTCSNSGHDIVVEKQIAPENVTTENATWVNETSKYFRKKLAELDVRLAEPYTFVEREGRAIQLSPYIGPNLIDVFRKSRDSFPILVKLLATMRGVLAQKTREVGIDARLSNFCLGPDGKVYYVDTFPPLVKYEGIFIVHFPNPTEPTRVEEELRRKFDPMGILRRLRFDMLAQDAGITETMLVEAVRCAMSEEFSSNVEHFFKALPSNNDYEKALAELTLDDPDAIRELALRFMPQHREARDEYLSSIFDLSSKYCLLKLTDEERLQRIRELFATN